MVDSDHLETLLLDLEDATSHTILLINKTRCHNQFTLLSVPSSLLTLGILGSNNKDLHKIPTKKTLEI